MSSTDSAGGKNFLHNFNVCTQFIIASSPYQSSASAAHTSVDDHRPDIKNPINSNALYTENMRNNNDFRVFSQLLRKRLEITKIKNTSLIYYFGSKMLRGVSANIVLDIGASILKLKHVCIRTKIENNKNVHII